MRNQILLLIIGTLCCLTWTVGVPAQIIFEADFDTTFPTFGYSFGYSGYGTEDCSTNIATDSETPSAYDVFTPPEATASFDTSAWNLPVNRCWNYLGWGFGIGYELPLDTRIDSGNLEDYTVTFDASVEGYDVIVGGLETKMRVVFQTDVDGDGVREDYNVGVDSDNLGNLPLVPFLTDTPQNFSLNLADLAYLSGELDFSTQFAETLQLQVVLEPYGVVEDMGFDADNILRVDNLQFAGPSVTLPSGDFNGDTFFDCTDIDELVAEIVAGTNNATFDMNGDGQVDPNDITDAGRGWLVVAGADASNADKTGGNPFLEGDANMDGSVDVSDFNDWNANKFTNGAGWCGGDFSADGNVDVSDFNTWNENKFQSSGNPASVPEPMSVLLIAWTLVVFPRLFRGQQ